MNWTPTQRLSVIARLSYACSRLNAPQTTRILELIYIVSTKDASHIEKNIADIIEWMPRGQETLDDIEKFD